MNASKALFVQLELKLVKKKKDISHLIAFLEQLISIVKVIKDLKGIIL